jgi:glycosyltransferase involved in cell wall biosynthesis
LVEQGVNGYIVDPDSVNDLTHRLTALAGDPALRATLGEASRLRSQAYLPEPVVDALEVEYRAVLAQRAHG